MVVTRYIFDYKARKVDYTRQAPEIPLILLALVDRFTNLGLVPSPPDQITINEYLPYVWTDFIPIGPAFL